MLLGWGVVGLLLSSAIPVRVEGDLGCELEASTARALERYLGRSTATELELGLRAVEGAIELELYSEGTVALARRIDLRSIGCLGVPDAAALIVERFFRDLGWTPGMPDLPRPPAPDPGPTPAIPTPAIPEARDPAPRDPAATGPTVERAPPSEPVRAPPVSPTLARSSTVATVTTATRAESKRSEVVSAPLDVELHLGAELRGAVPLELGAAGKLELSAGWFRSTVEGSFMRPESWAVTRAGAELGLISAWVVAFDLGLGACLSSRLRWCGRAIGGFESVFGAPSGTIFQTQALASSGLRLGLATTVEVALGARFELVGSLQALYRPSPVRFTIEGAAEEGYPRPNVSVLLGLGFRSKIL